MQVRFANKPATVPGVTTGLTPDEAEMDRCGLSHASLPRISGSTARVSGPVKKDTTLPSTPLLMTSILYRSASVLVNRYAVKYEAAFCRLMLLFDKQRLSRTFQNFRRTVFFTRGPPAITREAIIAAFRPWGEVIAQPYVHMPFHSPVKAVVLDLQT